MTDVGMLVVGAGPAGLGAAWELARRGADDWLVLEASQRVGGLARSITDAAGFTYDIGGHVMFSHYDRHRRAVEEALGDGYVTIDRSAWVWMHDRYVPYPFQLHVGALDPEVTYECVAGLLAAQREPHPDGEPSFDSWIERTFGSGIAGHFMRPYNRKVWATPLDDMSSAWIAERVAVVDVDRVLRNVVLGEDAADWGPNATFRYPARGGTGAIYEALAAPVEDRLRRQAPVVSIHAGRHVAVTADGSSWRYDELLATLPLDELIACCVDAPSQVRSAAAELRSIGTVVVGIGVDRPTPPERTWVYYPEPAVPFHRVTFLSNYSPHVTASPGQTLLLTEASVPHGAAVDPRDTTDATVDGLVDCGLLDPDDRHRIVTTWCHHAAKSYPVPTRDRDRRLATIEPWLASHGIANRGRFGSWRYEIGNMDHAFEMGAEWVDRVRDDEQETVWRPV